MSDREVGTGGDRFVLLYALANFGAFLCFVPLIGLFLPQRAMLLAPDQGVRLISWILLWGAVGSSIANFGAGWVSDRLMSRHGSRLPMVAVGLLATLASFVGLAAAATPQTLVLAFLLFQICFNLLFSPFNALATDHVRDAMKGRVFGLLSLGLPLAQLAIVAIVALGIRDMPMRLLLIAVAVTVTILPLLVVGRSAAGPPISPRDTPNSAVAVVGLFGTLTRDFALAWAGRLLVQCTAVATSSYLLIHLSDPARAGGRAEAWFSALALTALVSGLLVGVAIGRWSDSLARRRLFLQATALLVALGCALVGVGYSWAATASGYALFAVGLTGFLTIDGAVVAELVGREGDRGAQLGIMNLTNTLPALIVPLLALLLDSAGLDVTVWLFLCLSAGAVVTAALASMMRTIP
jgi:MFS family permease